MNKEEEIQSDIIRFLEELSFSDIKYDDWPIWWFFKRRFTDNHLLSPLPSHQQITTAILNDEQVDSNKCNLTVFALKKFISYNEKVKLMLSKLNKKTPTPNTNHNRKRIMFLVHTNGLLPDEKYGVTVDRIGSVVTAVREDPDLEEYLSLIDPLSFKAGLNLLKYENLVYSYIDSEIKKKATQNSFRLHKKWKEISEQTTHDSDSKTNISKYFRPVFELFFSQEIIYLIILYYEAYKKIVEQEKISFLCFYSGSDILSKCAIAAAHHLGVKSLHITHGFSIPQRNPDQPDSVYFAVFGHNYKKKLVQLGVDSKKIFVTGPTYMDEIIPYIKKKQLRNKRKNILLATGNFVEVGWIDKRTYVDYINKFLREVNKLSDTDVTIKKHPREDEVDYNSIIKSLEHRNVSVVGGLGKNQLKSRIYDLLHESDIVFSFGSTVSREAMIMSKPSLIIDLLPVPFEDDKTKIKHISPEEDLSVVIKDFLLDSKKRRELLKKQEEFMEEYFYKVDGKSGQRVRTAIKELIED